LNYQTILRLSPAPHTNQVIDHLFRHESGKLLSALVKLFGPHNLEMAEDVVQDTLLKAMEQWKSKGLPEQPLNWLFMVARNRAIDMIRREKREYRYAKDIGYLLQSEYTLQSTVHEMMQADGLQDDVLRMMFTCCHPSLPEESQVALVLKTLCGFSIPEIARAFLTRPDTIEKRLYRAKQQFRQQEVEFAIPEPGRLEERLGNVLTTIYLLFNEGYNATRHESHIRHELLAEAMRLCELLSTNPLVQHPNTFALLALMCFTNARNDARLDAEGNILLLKDQDRSRWNRELFQKGCDYLNRSARGEKFCSYHLEAAIAYEHSAAPTYEDTNWQHILHYYELLYQLKPGPVVALNKAVAISQVNSPEAGIAAIEAIPATLLEQYYLLHAILGELYMQSNQADKAAASFEKALTLTRSASEKKLLLGKLEKTGIK
jgi:RNA polymerase sigma factor (sigma-70 family)